MTQQTAITGVEPIAAGAQNRPPVAPRRRTRVRARTSLFATGQPMIWLTGGSLLTCVVMIVGLLYLILHFGMSTFWPLPVVELTTADGRIYMGEITRQNFYQPSEAVLTEAPAEILPEVRSTLAANEGWAKRRLVRTGNFRLTYRHFVWVNEFMVAEEQRPQWAVVMERLEWGRFYGFPLATAVIDYLDRKDAEGQTRSTEQLIAEARRIAESKQLGEDQAIRLLVDKLGNEVLIDPDDPTQMEGVTDVLGVAITAIGPEAAWQRFNQHHDSVRDRWQERRRLEKHDVGELNAELEDARLAMREAELNVQDAVAEDGEGSPVHAEALAELQRVRAHFEKVNEHVTAAYGEIREQIEQINHQNSRYRILMQTAGEGDAEPQLALMTLDQIVRAYPANQLSIFDKVGVYLSRWGEFLTDDPREANSEGGVYPAIFGTVLMTILLALVVVPFGVLAALYLREYAKAGPVVSAVRIAVNNLAGVPSIVFGVFGLGFFCYIVGGYIDGGPDQAGFAVLPERQWFMLLGALALLVVLGMMASVLNAGDNKKIGTGPSVMANLALGLPVLALWTYLGWRFLGWVMNFEDGGELATRSVAAGGVALVGWFAFRFVFFGGPGDRRPRLAKAVMAGGVLTCLLAGALAVLLVATTPFFDGFYRAKLPNPTFGKGALVWASLTLALLTLPVVIVATEEALAAVPNSMREGSYACGASKWQTIRRIVLPRAMPGIMTGMILAMARGAGEVAPLMLVGAVKLAQELPFDWTPPFGINNSFMHLGFHIYDVGFQSQNSEAAKPMVFTTTLLLIAIVATLNITAIWLRSRLRRKFVANQF